MTRHEGSCWSPAGDTTRGPRPPARRPVGHSRAAIEVLQTALITSRQTLTRLVGLQATLEAEIATQQKQMVRLPCPPCQGLGRWMHDRRRSVQRLAPCASDRACPACARPLAKPQERLQFLMEKTSRDYAVGGGRTKLCAWCQRHAPAPHAARRLSRAPRSTCTRWRSCVSRRRTLLLLLLAAVSADWLGQLERGCCVRGRVPRPPCTLRLLLLSLLPALLFVLLLPILGLA